VAIHFGERIPTPTSNMQYNAGLAIYLHLSDMVAYVFKTVAVISDQGMYVSHIRSREGEGMG
jgi:hypothetical protein